MKILFLDCDGVLNNSETKDYVKTSDGKKYIEFSSISFRGLDSFRINYIRNIVKQTNCKIVLSTSWRFQDVFKNYLIKKLGKKTSFAIIDSTPARISPNRFIEIKDWLDQHNEVKTFVILDDFQSEGLEQFGKNFICTIHNKNGIQENGMNKDDMNLAIELLNKR